MRPCDTPENGVFLFLGDDDVVLVWRECLEGLPLSSVEELDEVGAVAGCGEVSDELPCAGLFDDDGIGGFGYVDDACGMPAVWMVDMDMVGPFCECEFVFIEFDEGWVGDGALDDDGLFFDG